MVISSSEAFLFLAFNYFILVVLYRDLYQLNFEQSFVLIYSLIIIYLPPKRGVSHFLEGFFITEKHVHIGIAVYEISHTDLHFDRFKKKINRI